MEEKEFKTVGDLTKEELIKEIEARDNFIRILLKEIQKDEREKKHEIKR